MPLEDQSNSVVMDGPINFQAEFDDDEFRNHCEKGSVDVLLRTCGACSRFPDLGEDLVEFYNDGQAVHWQFSYLDAAFEAQLTILSGQFVSAFPKPYAELQIRHVTPKRSHTILKLLMRTQLFELLVQDAKFLLMLGTNYKTGVFKTVAKWMNADRAETFESTLLPINIFQLQANEDEIPTVRKSSIREKFIREKTFNLSKALSAERSEYGDFVFTILSEHVPNIRYSESSREDQVFVTAYELIDYINEIILSSALSGNTTGTGEEERQVSGISEPNYGNNRQTREEVTKAFVELAEIQGLEGDARLLRKKRKLDEKVTPIFEGTVDNEFAIEALKRAQIESGFSERKFAEHLGVSRGAYRNVIDGRGTIDKATELLDKAGYEIHGQLVRRNLN